MIVQIIWERSDISVAYRMIELLIVMNASNKCRIHEKKCGVYSRAAFIRVITVLDFGSLALA